ncbi:MAG: hypothetical protein WD844_11395 [Thermoleophilaceae bacterium]
MDYEAVRAGLEAAIPFNNHVGLEVVEVAEVTVDWHVRRNA